MPNPTNLTEQQRYERGLAAITALDANASEEILAALGDVAPDLARHLVAYGFGDVYTRPGLQPQQRQLVTLGILTALGGCEPQLEVHINAALDVGLTPTEIVEALTHCAVYCGFPKALNAVFAAKRVLTERGLLSTS